MSQNVLCLGLSEDTHTITQIFFLKKSDSIKLTDESEQILQSLLNSLIQASDWKTLKGNNGIWCCQKLNSMVLFTCVDQNYQERLAYKLLIDFKGLYESFGNHHDLKRLQIDSEKLLRKYNAPEQFDLLSQANQQVQDVQIQVQENLNKMVENNENLSQLEIQTHQMMETANQFEKGTKKVEWVMWWRKTRSIILIIVAVIIIIVVIVLLAKFV